ncbi:TonB family protein [Dysgonomonas sp. 25]|uniref:TonB family protein n=1 Tax=Dysgonomonas sp. 25 TaxID=2302933 RepID=UPI0013D1CFA8|nr:TonB family protein [Dysgonomonas sp. 25]NDV69070.1 TonB family protein [Dysgonomonas sp. 25]
MKTIITSLIFILLGFSALSAQIDSTANYKEAQFPGGESKLNMFIRNNLVYPIKAHEAGIQGKVVASFTIREDGKIENITIEESIGKPCDDEVINLIRRMPEWEPAQRNGKNIASPFRLPVNFGIGKIVPENGLAALSNPQFPGGEQALLDFIQTNLRYPAKSDVKGIAWTSFTITEKGEIKDIKIIKSLGKDYDKEVKRLIKSMPNWIPAKWGKQNAAAFYELPINFGVEDITATELLTDTTNYTPPHFFGGEKAMNEFIIKNMRYPLEALKRDEQGVVKILLTIAEDGNIENIKVLEGPSRLLIAEAVRVTKLMPKWIPATRNGENVTDTYTIPISFKIQSGPVTTRIIRH